MRVTDAWLIYILVVLFVFIILSLVSTSASFDLPTRLFFAFLVGVIIILVLIPNIVALPEERSWYSLLLVIAFLVPIGLAAWMIWHRRWPSLNLSESESGEEAVHREYVCDPEGESCRLIRVTSGNDTYTYE